MTVQLVLLFIFMITASVTDVKTGKVRNKDIVIYLALGLILYGTFTAKGLMAGDATTLIVLQRAGLNLAIAFVVSFAVRSAGVWPAGDAKTYVVANLLMPLTCYKHVYFSYFPGFTLLINVFMAGIVYIIYKSAVVFIKSTLPSASLTSSASYLRKTTAKLAAEWPSHLKVFSSYVIVFFTMNLIAGEINSRAQLLEKLAPEAFIVALFFIMRPVGGFVNSRLSALNHFILYLIFAVAVFLMNGWSFDKSMEMLANMSLNALKFMVFYGAIRSVADYYINKAQTVGVDIEGLKEGDLPTREFLNSLSPDAKESLRVAPEGITAGEAETIKRDVVGKGGDRAVVYEPIPFVPIIFAGVIFTVIAGISSVHYVKLLVFR
ncbi:MAG TPA: hypothetical protein PLS19_05850 [bacterium]|nr:hypothetical protein [bacterium]